MHLNNHETNHENSNEQPQLNFRDTTRTTEDRELTGCFPRSKLVTRVGGESA